MFTVFKKEIEEDLKLEERYKLSHTNEELGYRKKLQEKFKFMNLQKSRLPLFSSLMKTWDWLRRYYFNLNAKQSINEYEYAKKMRYVNNTM